MLNLFKYWKDSRYDILTAMMSANASTNGTASDWEQITQFKEQR